MATLVAVAALGVRTAMIMNNTIHSMYAAWWVGDMVVEHLRANNDNWPRNWDDLKDDYDTCVSNSGSAPWGFDELKSRVRIDWNADANILVSQQTNGEPEFEAIWLDRGSNASWANSEPNQIVLNYLNRDR